MSPQASARTLLGYWEGDLIKGAGNRSAVGVLLERSSRLAMLIKLADATATSALEGFSAKLRSIAEPMRQALTYDQGTEMARHAERTANTGVMVYFCDPHSPWQRGSRENTNGLTRQYLPKGTDLSVHSPEQLNAIANLLNNRPGKSALIGVDVESVLVHTVMGRNVNDVTQACALMHGEETYVFADVGYEGVGRREDTQDIELTGN